MGAERENLVMRFLVHGKAKGREGESNTRNEVIDGLEKGKWERGQTDHTNIDRTKDLKGRMV